MAEPEDMVVPLLREMRAENAREHQKTRELISELEKRLGGIEGAQVSFRNALSADSLLSKLVTGDFEERLVSLQSKVRELESLK